MVSVAYDFKWIAILSLGRGPSTETASHVASRDVETGWKNMCTRPRLRGALSEYKNLRCFMRDLGRLDNPYMPNKLSKLKDLTV